MSGSFDESVFAKPGVVATFVPSRVGLVTKPAMSSTSISWGEVRQGKDQ